MKSIVTLMLCLCTLSAGAQPVYRCGNAYSDSPCPQARLVDASDPRSEAQRADAQRLAANDKQLGEQLARERRTMDAAQARAVKPISSKPAKPVRATKIRWFRP